ncbi:MAG TPA: peptide deformylase [Chthoniobacterales bacterium]|jgi:peptide deformylase
MVLPIVTYGHPVLRTKGKEIKEITPALKKLAMDMLETMVDAEGVGLAAQQVGHAIQLTVIDVQDSEDRPSTMSIDGKAVKLADHMPLILLNPKLELTKETESGNEGCLSFPEMNAMITRPAGVSVTALGLDGKEIRFSATGLLARAVQHETDHLNGVLFIDRMSPAKRVSLAGKLKRLQRG